MELVNTPSLTDDVEPTALDDVKKDAPIDPKAGSIVSFVDERMRKAETARYSDEQRWLRSFRNYRGVYDPSMAFTDSEKSRIFVKVTKTKVLAAYGQLADVVFGSGKFPLSVEPTTLPEGVADSVHFDTQPMPAEGGGPQEKPELKPGELYDQYLKRLGPLKGKLDPVKDKIKNGPGTSPTQVTFHPALVAAKNMEKKIHDQLEEANASKHLRRTLFEQALLGTGVLKGPFKITKEYPQWDEDGTYNPTVKTIPHLSHVSVWNCYPDPDADNVDECEFFIERHKLSKSQVRKLKTRPMFRKEAVELAVLGGPSYIEKWWEQHINDEQTTESPDRYEVLEFWGYVDGEMLKEYEVDLDRTFEDDETVAVNIWVCNNQVMRLVVNPYQPSYIPYHACPYELNPYSFWGIGVAENMDDTQTMMNGFMRMAIDNAALSGNMIIEIDETNLVPGQDMKIYPGKVFRRQGGAPGQAIFSTKWQNVSNENMQMFDKARQLADESTGLPSFAHGQTGVTGVGRTSSGISMLMSAANGSIKTVVKNIDDYLISPVGKALFHFNMQFDFDKSIVGDLEIKARGTESLMATEVRSQRLLQFLTVVQNPILAPFAKMDYIIREIAQSMDLDPEKVTNSLADAAIQAEIMKKFQATMAPPEQGAGGPPPPSDTSGGGNSNIGIGSAPQPGQQGFTGTPQGGMNAQAPS